MPNGVDVSGPMDVPELAAQLRALVDSGAAPVTADEIMDGGAAPVTYAEVVDGDRAGGQPPPSRSAPQEPLRTRRSVRWAVLAAAAAVVALVVALVVPTSSPSDAVALQRVRSSPAAAARVAPTTHVVETITARDRSGTEVAGERVAGSIDPAADTFDLVSTAYESQYRVPLWSLGTLSDGRAIYFQMPADFVGHGAKPWVAYPVPAPSAARRAAPSSSLSAARGPVVSLGERTIRGVHAEGYAVTLDTSTLIAHAMPSLQTGVRQSFASVPRVRVRVWLGPAGQPIETDYTYSGPGAPVNTLHDVPGQVLRYHVRSTITYRARPLTVTAPPASQVAFAPNAAAASRLVTRYAAGSL